MPDIQDDTIISATTEELVDIPVTLDEVAEELVTALPDDAVRDTAVVKSIDDVKIGCVATDGNVQWCGGFDQTNRRGAIVKLTDGAGDALTALLTENCVSVGAITTDIEDGEKIVIAVCVTTGGGIVVVKFNDMLQVISSYEITDKFSPIHALTKWKDNYLIGTVNYENGDRTKSTPAIIIVEKDLSDSQIVILTMKDLITLDTFDVSSRITGFASNETSLYVCGNSFTLEPRSCGFLARISDNLEAVGMIILEAPSTKETALTNVELVGDTVQVFGLFSIGDSTVPESFVTNFSLDLVQLPPQQA